MHIPQLIIGNKNYSSWSLRAWLLLAKLGIDFEEIRIPLSLPNTTERLLAYSPAARVPIYVIGDFAIWDSLAIAEYLAEEHPHLWPNDTKQRALARSIVSEMHSGFVALRTAMPMNCRASKRKIEQTEAVAADIERIQAIWTDCRNRNSQAGPWLFGSFTIPDAVYAPVVSRFYTYGVSCNSVAAAYMKTVLNDPDVRNWFKAAKNEKETIEHEEVGREWLVSHACNPAN
ncbi:glutathione S-transferase family protein [Chloroflexi bacterium TSY]|nr:glutathione S-transferase family protein [Chloroflexi bacterium TSY]